MHLNKKSILYTVFVIVLILMYATDIGLPGIAYDSFCFDSYRIKICMFVYLGYWNGRIDKKEKITIYRIGLVCAIVQVVLSTICLVNSIITSENIAVWVLMMGTGVCFACINGRMVKQNKDNLKLVSKVSEGRMRRVLRKTDGVSGSSVWWLPHQGR